jgi:ABC-2 type transport system permease protein
VVETAELAGSRGVAVRGERFRPYRLILLAQLRAQMSYRGSFVIDVLSGTALTAMDLATVIVLFHVTSTVGGFAFHDAFLMSALASLAFATADQIAGEMDGLRVDIRTGQLDALLVRPLPLLPQLMSTEIQLRRLGRIVQGLVVVVIAAGLAHVHWSVSTVALLVLTPIAGTAFFVGMFVATATVAFWWIDSGEFGNGFTYGGRDFTNYPVTVYGQFFRRAFAVGLGFAFVSYYPVLTILDRPDPLGLPPWTGWLSPLAGAASCGLATIAWRVGVRRYRSTGS